MRVDKVLQMFLCVRHVPSHVPVVSLVTLFVIHLRDLCSIKSSFRRFLFPFLLKHRIIDSVDSQFIHSLSQSFIHPLFLLFNSCTIVFDPFNFPTPLYTHMLFFLLFTLLSRLPPLSSRLPLLCPYSTFLPSLSPSPFPTLSFVPSLCHTAK